MLALATHSAQAAEVPLYSFCAQISCTDGQHPIAGLVQGTNGRFYGTTFQGGANGSGTVFQITPSGTFTTLYDFCPQSGCADGRYLYAPLVQGSDGNFYGTTYQGGANNDSGSVFQITPNGALKTLYSFCAQSGCADGRNPYAGLVQGSDGNFYGTTLRGGGSNDSGTVFQITPSGTLKTLYSFCPQTGCVDGQFPFAGLVQGTDGNLYGITQQGGSNSNSGTIFQITTSGALTTLYSFCAQSGCVDGMNPYAGVIQGVDGNFYGTTYLGGTDGVGTVFQITSAGTLTVLYSFCPQTGCADGAEPVAGLVQGNDGNFYGTTVSGGTSSKGFGTLFQITSTGSLTTLYRFCQQSGCVDGAYPEGSLVQGSNGNFYGTTYQGGTNNQGAVFKLTAPTSTSLTSSPNPSTYGQSVTFSARVSSASGTPTGRVTFLNGSGALGSAALTGGISSLARTNINVGTNSITAAYSGSTKFSGSTSSPLSQVVTQARTTVTLTSSANPSTRGQSVTFSATVVPQFSGTPAGKVDFKKGGTTLATVTLASGVATYSTASLTSGSHSITAKYSGNSSFSASSTTLTQTVH